ncbi:MAG: S8 family serine peptidase [Muribaculaceae bacterium]|nr:S8 family serine peptidase [Muribaculaceae bacterium]
MKKIPFGRDRKGIRRPFWQPWGAWGYLRKLLLFLLLIGILILLLSLFRRCGNDRATVIPDDILHPDVEEGAYPEDDSLIGGNLSDPGEFLPGEDNNFLIPIDEGDVRTDPEDGRRFVADKLNVMLDSESDDSTFREWSERFKTAYPGDEYKVTYYDTLTKLMQIQVPGSEAEKIMAELPSKIPEIKFFVFPEGLMGEWSKPSDPAFSKVDLSWYFPAIEAYSAWDVTMGDPNVTVAVVDTYFDLRHPELSGGNKVRKPYNLVKRNRDVMVPPTAGGNSAQKAMRSHGTSVACLAVGNAGNRAGASGIAPKCSLMPVAMENHLTSLVMLQGLLYSIYQGADVVNISAGAMYGQNVAQMSPREQVELSKNIGIEEQRVWDYAFRLADERRVTIVWAAGNENIFTALDPSKRGKNTVKVSSTDRHGKKAEFSDYGNFPQWNVYESTVSAPGVGIFSAIPGKTFGLQDGTSFSAPIVAGGIALLKSKKRNLTNQEIIKLLRSTGKPVGERSTIGPILQLRRALDKI